MPLPNVVVIGGGVAGLTAAHELKERGFSVRVYEKQSTLDAAPQPVLGGKARSFPVPLNAAYGWDKLDEGNMIVGLPAEHGFRFFPGFYQHVIDTFGRIPREPDPDKHRGKYVIDNLIDIEHAAYAQEGKPFFRFGTKRPETLQQFWKALKRLFLRNPSLGISPVEAAFAASKLVNAMTMCDERREAELESVSWWDYMSAGDMSDAYKTVIINGLTQNFVAMDARYSSTKSVINILARMLNDFMTRGRTMDRILNGPTSVVWIDPWRRYLEAAAPGQPAVQFQKAEVESFVFDSAMSRITGVNLTGAPPPQAAMDPDAYYILAVPVEAATKILDKTAEGSPEIFEHSPSLKLIRDLKVNWMTGIVYYLVHDFEMCPGHIVYLNSTWAITSISQNQFWPKKIDDYGRPGVKGDISAIISDWDRPGTKIWRRPAREAENADQIAREACAQVRAHLTGIPDEELSENDKGLSKNDREPGDSNLVGYCLDLAIVFKKMQLLGLMSASEFTNRLRSWPDRPAAVQLRDRLQKLQDEAFARTLRDELERRKERKDPWVDVFKFLLGPAIEGELARPLEDWLKRSAAVLKFVEEVLDNLAPAEWPSRFGAFLERTLLNALVAQNQEPLFINTVGSWSARPTASTSIENLFLASDYVKTSTDLATMEGANEAGRRAVNGILEAENSRRARCEIFKFQEPGVLAPFKAIDKELFEYGLPHPSFLLDPFLSFGARVAKQARK
jgi:uncharacterized protein with NAD-binding domain and iron-sulfur cluster